MFGFVCNSLSARAGPGLFEGEWNIKWFRFRGIKILQV